MTIDLAIIALFLLSNLLIGYMASRKTTSFEHFSVGHRNFSSVIIFCSLSATFIGGGYTIGNANKVYTSGLVYTFALLGFSLKEVLVASFIAPRMGQFQDCHSIGDMVAKYYGQKAKLMTGVLSLVICGGILGAQVEAVSAILKSTTSINPVIGTLISLTVLLVYSSLGGMRAVVFTDTFQFIILSIGMPLTLLFGLHAVGGVSEVIKAVPTHYLHFMSDTHDLIFFVLLFVTFVFGETLVPPYVQRLFMAKSTKDTFKGTLASGLFSIPFFLICGSIGLVAYTFDKHLPAEQAFPTIINQVLPIGLRGFVIASLLSIILSSAAGFLNAASIAFVNDIVKPLTVNRRRTINDLRLARISTLIVGVIAVLFAFSVDGILDILLASYGFWSPIIVIPLIAAIFSKRKHPLLFFVPGLMGVLATLCWQYLLAKPWGIPPILFGLAINGLGYWLVEVTLNRGDRSALVASTS